jgi:hypothetical protein
LDIVLWVVAGIIILNIAAIVRLAVFVVLDRRRTMREVAQLEALLRLEPRRVTGSMWQPRGRRSTGRRAAALGLAAALVGTTVAIATPQGRSVILSALETVVPGFQQEPREGDRAGARDSGGGSSLPTVSGPVTVDTLPPGTTSSRAAVGRNTTISTKDPTPAQAEPATPSRVTAVAQSSTAIIVTWSDVRDETAFQVERSTDGVTGWVLVGRTGRDDTAYSDGGLSPETTFYYRVFATNPAGPSRPSDVTSATTTIATPSPTTTVMAVSVSANAILLTWTDVADETGYRVERSTDGANDWVTITTTAQDVTTHKDAGLPPGTTYYYRVFATNSGGDSAPSTMAWATTLGHVIGPTGDDATSSSAESPSDSSP